MTAGYRIALVGAGGFIGRRIASALAAENVETIGYTRSEAKARDIVGIPVQVVGSTLADLTAALRRFRPSVVLNLAATGVMTPATASELETGNVGVVSAIMDAAAGGGTELIIHAGSWSQYGPFESVHPVTEDHPQRPTTAYGSAKARAEAAGLSRASAGGAQFVSLRLFNVYGPGEARHRLIPTIALHLAGGQKVPLSEGRQVRDFVYVDDVVSAFMACLSTPVSGSAAFNVATGVGTAVRDVARLAAQCMSVTNTRLDFGALEARSDEPSVVIGDSTRFRTTFGWAPHVSVAAGVCDTVEWATEGAALP